LYYLLFFVYLLLGCYLVTRIPFIRKAGIGNKTIIALFLAKVLAGLLIGWLSNKYNPGTSDYWWINADGWLEYQLLRTDPREFFSNIFRSSYDHYDGFFNSIGSYWNDLKNNIIIKILAFCNIFTRGNYYVNSLFLNFFAFMGSVALYRVFSHIYIHKKRLLIAGCFLLPSTLYFTSGIHKDLVVYTMLAFLCYAVYFSVEQHISLKRILIICLTMLGLLLIRNFVLIMIIPPILAFIICMKKGWKPWLVFSSTYLLMILGISLVSWIYPSLAPLQIIVQKQQDFLNLPVAASQLPMPVLTADPASFVQHFFLAVNHGFLRPYPWEPAGPFLFPLSIELYFYLFLMACAFFFRDRANEKSSPFIYLSICFALSLLLINGYIVPNMGSLVRYRSIYWPFLIVPLLAIIRLPKVLNKHINL
jgi:hypothetical protein